MNCFHRFTKNTIVLFISVFLLSVPTRPSTPGRTSAPLGAATNACGQFALKNSNYYRISRSASALTSADFNNDGIPDLAAAMPDTNNIAVALGNDQTGFEEAREFIAGVSPQELAVGDFNRDGEMDIAATSSADRMLNLLTGDGAGNFKLWISHPIGNSAGRFETADLNNDGWGDFVVARTDFASLSLSVYLGSAAGLIAANPAAISLNGTPQSLKIEDFNGDGNRDIIAVAHNTAGSGLPSYVRLFQGNGLGDFTDALTISLGEFYDLETADFNSDGFADFAVFVLSDEKARVYLNNGSGGFNAPLEISLSGMNISSQAILSGDLNDDGKIDLAISSVMLLNDGKANFTLRQTSDTLGSNVLLADFNGDGIVDQSTGGDIYDQLNGGYWTLRVADGTGDARFNVPFYLQGVGGTSQALTGDYNNDGRTDIVLGNTGSSFNQLQIAFQNADGSFNIQRIGVSSGTANGFTIVAAGDFNNDGKPDIATNITWARRIVILTNDGNGQFTLSGVTMNGPQFSYNLEYFQPGDFNNDGYTDFIAASQNSLLLVLNNGSAGGYTVQPFGTSNSLEGFKRIAVGDFNNDGNQDFALARTNNLFYYRGNGNGSFDVAGFYQMPLGVSMIRSSDLNNDGQNDLVVTTGGNFTIGGAGVSLFMSNSDGLFLQTDYTIPGGPGDIVISDLNGDSFKDFLVLNSPNNYATLFAGSGNGEFTAQPPVISMSALGGAAADFNQDQKPDLIMGAQFSAGPSRIFYNATLSAPCLAVSDATVTEGDSGSSNAQFTVSLSAPSAQEVSVEYRLVGRNARSNEDFTPVSGTLTIPAGTQTQTVSVAVTGDTKDEADETFQLVLASPVNASLSDRIGVGKIIDNDAPPSFTISDAVITEGTGAGSLNLTFTASLSAAPGRKAKTVFEYENGTATGGSDFESLGGTLVFNEGESVKQIVVKVNPDAFVEPDENFKVRLSMPSNLVLADNEAIGTITNDDFGGAVEFAASVVETGENSDSVMVSVLRRGGAAAGVTLSYTTSDGTATANRDYLPSAGKLVFEAGETEKNFIIPILDDATDEQTVETVNLTLANITGGGIPGQQSTAVLNISDNDPAPVLTLSGADVGEGGSGTTALNFEVRLLARSEQPVSVNFATADGTANAPRDYQSATGTLNFAPGEVTKTISVLVGGDTEIEPDETFFLNLSSPVNVTLQNNQVTGTIVNDDTVTRRAPFDFDGDGKTDLGIFRANAASGAEWWYSGSINTQVTALQFGASGDRAVPGDFTGDGRTDIAVFRPLSGEWFVLRSEDGSFYSFPFGAAGDVPVVGDFDGDGRTDPGVFRPSIATWFISKSTGGVIIVGFGAAGDKPVIADYDGDGKSDIAVYRNNNGTSEWWIERSSDSQVAALQFGASTDRAVPGDYTGDGKADIAIWRPASGEWFILRSDDFSYYAFPFGAAGDVPVPGDYDGDGKFDAGVFRPSGANWFVQRSTAGTLIQQFGAAGDQPVPNVFIP